MNIDYFTLLSYNPIFIKNVGHIKPILLKDIAKVGLVNYKLFINILSMTTIDYFQYIESDDNHMYLLTDEEKSKILYMKEKYYANPKSLGYFEIVTYDSIFTSLIKSALEFFCIEKVTFEEKNKYFILENEHGICGKIDKDNFLNVKNVILKMNYISERSESVIQGKPKNKTAEKIMKKLQTTKNEAVKKDNQKNSLANIISSLSIHSKNYNITNIWELTVFQLYDQFTRQRQEDIYSIISRGVSFHGDSESKFDDTAWFNYIHEN